MKKFAANYILTGNFKLLKNSIIISEDSENITEIIDTKGELRELDRMEFLNGIITSGFSYEKGGYDNQKMNDNSESTFFFEGISNHNLLMPSDFIKLCIKFQEINEYLNIPEIINQVDIYLTASNKYIKTKLDGVYLLQGLDLPRLKFRKTSRIKKLL